MHRAPGSSPLTRGKLSISPSSSPSTGLIPAHAGKTSSPSPLRVPSKAHPRSRGENAIGAAAGVIAAGSSPLTRGKPDGLDGASAIRGLIPAHAGKTSSTLALSSSREAHPRSRGENQQPVEGARESPGSSPLTRGKRFQQRRVEPTRGLIPAHAGKTRPDPRRRLPVRAHPRSRGENEGGRRRLPPQPGSSPLTRGKPTGRHGRSPKRRLIPAHAGKTRPSGHSRMRSRAHPRSRGKTAGPRATSHPIRAHPRSRGENSSRSNVDSSLTGSSPLTRGKLGNGVKLV